MSRRIALLVETSTTFGRGVLRGVGRYLREHGRWSMFLEQRALGSNLADWIDHWDGDGIVTRHRDHRLDSVSVPVVALDDDSPPEASRPTIINDSHAVGRLAAEHMAERGFRRLAYYGPTDTFWSAERLRGVQETISGQVQVCPHDPHLLATDGWEAHQEALAHWLSSLQRPVGLVAANDTHALRALDAAARAGLGVPEDVAVIGADDDAELCDLSDPPLSSVAFDSERVGFEAAKLLDHLIDSGEPPTGPRFIAPRGVIRRKSTDALAVADQTVAAALAIIRKRACQGLSVTELVEAVPISRRSLELRFQEAIGRSPKQEIQRTRVRFACELLVETDLPIVSISRLSGFSQPSRFGVVFKQHAGRTPSQYREFGPG